MTPEERQLVTGLFDRMRNFGNPEKDRDAEALISERVRAMPDAPYMLVQSVLVQEQALQQAEARIRDLEDQVRDMESSQSRAPASGGSFLGGLFGGGRPAAQPGPTSVPPIGSRAADFPAAGRDRPAPYDRPGPYYDTPPPQGPAGGGFLRSAMSTAAGVAGGVLAAGAIRDLMGGSGAHASTASAANTASTAAANKENATSGTDASNQQQASAANPGDNNTQTVRDDQGGKGSEDQDNNYQDAYDDSSDDWDSGGDYDV